MNCPKCDTQISDNDLFCHNCGTNIKENNTPKDDDQTNEAKPEQKTEKPKEKKSFKKFKLIALALIIFVIIIVALVYTYSTGGLDNAAKKARDAKRIADIEVIKTALDLYASENDDNYPNTLKELGDFLPIIPTNPLPNDGNCLDNVKYDYKVKDQGQSYELSFCLGSKLGRYQAGVNTMNP